MMLKDVPIRRKLMLMLLLMSVIVMLLMRGTFFVYEYVTFRQTTVRQISTLAQVLASNSTAALAFENQDDAKEILSSLRHQNYVVASALYDAKGVLFAQYPSSLAPGALPPAPGGGGFSFSGARLSGFQPVLQGDRRLGMLYIEFDAGSLMSAWLWHSLEIALAVMAVILVFAFVLARVLQKQISGPVLALAQTATAVSERNDYSVRAERTAGGELGLLTDAFNQMLSQIQALNQDLEQRVHQRTAQLEAANKELEAFSYSVSHDLRAPRRHIDGFAQLLGTHLEGKLDDTGRRYLKTIEDSAKRLGKLIDELLNFCRMGRSEMHKLRVDNRALVDVVVNELEHETKDRKIEWKIGDLPAVSGDPSMLRQVWSNLIGNALKYSRRRDVAVIEITHTLDGGAHQFEIRDNGAGFDMAYAGKLFGVFQRLHHAKDFEGTGVGLANVRRMVERHGGKAWAEGKPDVGATFFFTIPADNPSASD